MHTGTFVFAGMYPQAFFLTAKKDSQMSQEAQRLLRIERDLGMLLCQEMSLDSALSHCLSAAMGASGLDSGGIYVLKPDGYLELRVHANLSPQFISAVKHFQPDSPFCHLVHAGKTICSENTDFDIGVQISD